MTNSDPTQGIVLYHGGRRWVGKPEIRAPYSGKAEYGPGLYFTNSAETAAKYAKGSNVITKVVLDPGLRWLHEAGLLALPALEAAVEQFPRIGQAARDGLLRDLRRNAQRRDTDWIRPEVLINLMVNAGLVNGERALAVARWLTEQGIDASLNQVNGNLPGYEDWVVVSNPAVILSHEVVSRKDIDWANPFLPGVRTQLEAFQDEESSGTSYRATAMCP